MYLKKRNIKVYNYPMENNCFFDCDYLYQTKNIKFYEFVDLNSKEFTEIMYNCCFTIFPSSSEGGNPSTLTVMGNGGLIPIVSDSCAIDTYGYGINIDENTHKGVLKSIREARKMKIEEIKLTSQNIYNKINKEHNFKDFYSNIKKLISNILKKY